MTDDHPPVTRNKVGRIIADYDLTGVGDELERRWTTDADDRWSLRDLADWFNKRLLEAVLREHDHRPVEETLETTYRLLTADDVSPVASTQTKRDLKRQGVDVDDLRESFVSHQAIYRYLTKYRDAEAPTPDRETTIERAREMINRLQGKTAAVTESSLDRLRTNGALSLGEVDVLVTVEVHCADCGESAPVNELIAAGGCACQE